MKKQKKKQKGKKPLCKWKPIVSADAEEAMIRSQLFALDSIFAVFERAKKKKP